MMVARLESNSSKWERTLAKNDSHSLTWTSIGVPRTASNARLWALRTMSMPSIADNAVRDVPSLMPL